MNRWIIVIGLFILILIGFVALIVVPAPGTVNAPTGNGTSTTTAVTEASLPDLIVVSSPLPNSTIKSPLGLTGKARGGWYFEASAPYKLKNAGGIVIAEGPMQAIGDWMTSDFVPFSATITFPAQPAGSVGTLILMNDNPSGLPENQKVLEIPVKF